MFASKRVHRRTAMFSSKRGHCGTAMFSSKHVHRRTAEIVYTIGQCSHASVFTPWDRRRCIEAVAQPPPPPTFRPLLLTPPAVCARILSLFLSLSLSLFLSLSLSLSLCFSLPLSLSLYVSLSLLYAFPPRQRRERPRGDLIRKDFQSNTFWQ